MLLCDVSTKTPPILSHWTDSLFFLPPPLHIFFVRNVRCTCATFKAIGLIKFEGLYICTNCRYWIKVTPFREPGILWSPICEKEVAEALRTTLSWKAPGRDQTPNFWLKQLTATHKHIAEIFSKLTEEDFIPEWLKAGVTYLIPEWLKAGVTYLILEWLKAGVTYLIPEWLTAGVTYLIPKNQFTGNPKNYRPVTCLPKTYKLFTSIISRRVQKCMDNENLLPKEQKGCSSGINVCKDQPLISKVILRECKSRKKVWLWHWLNIGKLFTGCHIVPLFKA